MKKLHLISLGCSKNLVDSEKILYAFSQEGWDLTDEPAEADVIVVNTCGFIEAAKQEAIDTLLEMAQQKKPGALLIATGCLAQRYSQELYDQMEEIDLVVGIDQCERIVRYAKDFTTRAVYRNEPLRAYESGRRVHTGAPHYAYVRIADGCNNFCSYCAIPLIRGRYRSRETEDILCEIRDLAAQGVREIILVAQDTTRYGSDTKRGDLAELLCAAAHVEGVEWVRFLYAYPEMLTDEMIAAMVEEEHVCKYVDIPLQHCNDRILKKMNRHVTRAQIEALLEKLAAQPVRIAVRTTLMTGFPTETLEEHEELLDFMRKWRFDRLGAFAFCPEEGTAAEKMDGQIDEDEKQRRLDEIMALQQEISLSNNIARAKTGGEETVVVDSFDRNEGVIYTRSQYEVPEVDGSILLPLAPEDPDPIVGMTLTARLTDAMAYDLIGELE